MVNHHTNLGPIQHEARITMARSHHNIKLLHGQRGGVAIWFALCLPVLLGFAALAVDLARINLTKTELQNAADAAALAGARSLTVTPMPSGQIYNWPAAEAMALTVAQRNYANGAQIQSTQITCSTPFYWSLPNGNVPAINVTVTLPLNLFFAPIWGINQKTVQASATAMIAPPASGTGMFPMAINKKMFDLYWNSDNNSPELDSTGKPYEIDISSVYSGNIISGQWTSFQNDYNDVPTVRDLIQTGNTTSVSIGDWIWIEPGVKTTIYNTKEGNKNTPLLPLIGTDVALPVVNSVDTHTKVQVVAIAGFHLESVYQKGNKSYIIGHFIDPTTIPNINPGTGNGTQYGAYTPPALVE